MRPMRLYDAHNHLQDAGLAPFEAQIVNDLAALPIAGAVVNGTLDSDWDRVEQLADAHPWIIPSYGIHPWKVASRAVNWQALLLQKLDGGKPCAIGEIGLDRWIKQHDFEDQKTVFLWQLRLAAERNLPATIHCLKAWGPLWEMLQKEPVPECGFLLHAYGGPAEMVEGFAQRGAYFSFSGSFLDERKSAKRAAFLHVPRERLLVETDAPAMPLPPGAVRFPLPASVDGAPLNHPANLLAVYEGVAALLEEEAASVAESVAKNFERLFGKPAAD